MKAFLFPFSSVSILGAQGVEELIAEGDALDRKNKIFEAVAFYLKADSQKPEEAKILWRISKQYAQLMMDAKSASERKRLGQKALDAAQGAVSADPKDSQAHLSLAIAYFAKAIALQPQRVIHRVELGRAYLAIGKREKARDAFNKGISLPSAENDDDNNKARAREMLKQLP